MRAIAAVCGLAFSFGALASGDDRAWTPYQNPEAGYKVAFPGAPTIERSKCHFDGKPAVYTSASMTLEGATLSVHVVVTGGRATGADALSATVKSLMTRGGQAELSESGDMKVGGAPAKHMVSLAKDGSTRMESFSFLHGRCGYVVLTVCPNLPGRYETLRQHFFSSFDFLSK